MEHRVGSLEIGHVQRRLHRHPDLFEVGPCGELGHDPAEKVAVFRIPGAWEDEGFKILEKYGIEYFDRSVSMHEAAKRAVEKIQG